MLAQNQKLEKKLRVSLLDKEAVENGNMPNLFVFYQKGDAEGYFSERMNAPYLSTELPIMVGDLSQLWASLAIQQLVEAHQFSYSADLNQFLPQGYQNMMPVTIEHLLSHSAGLSKIPNNFGQYEQDQENPYRYYSDTALLAYYRAQNLTGKAGKYQYSLTGYALLQYVLAQFEVFPPTLPAKMNVGHKNRKKVEPLPYYQFSAAKGLALSPNEIIDLLKQVQQGAALLPQFPTLLEKKTYVSYGFHVLHRKDRQIGILKSASNGFTILAAFDLHRPRLLLAIADSQDYKGLLYGPISWFFKR